MTATFWVLLAGVGLGYAVGCWIERVLSEIRDELGEIRDELRELNAKEKP